MFKVKRNLKSATKRNCCLVRHKKKKETQKIKIKIKIIFVHFRTQHLLNTSCSVDFFAVPRNDPKKFTLIPVR